MKSLKEALSTRANAPKVSKIIKLELNVISLNNYDIESDNTGKEFNSMDEFLFNNRFSLGAMYKVVLQDDKGHEYGELTCNIDADFRGDSAEGFQCSLPLTRIDFDGDRMIAFDGTDVSVAIMDAMVNDKKLWDAFNKEIMKPKWFDKNAIVSSFTFAEEFAGKIRDEYDDFIFSRDV